MPAALFNFALFTAIAVFLDESRAHAIAAGCLAFAYVVAIHVIVGHVPWQNLQMISLLQVMAKCRNRSGIDASVRCVRAG